MPLYDYKCSQCEHTFTKSSSIADRKIPVESPCPECGQEGTISQLIGAPGIGDPHRMGRIKPPSGFNEVLRNIKKGNPGSTINIRD